jgi:hypothetical protein
LAAQILQHVPQQQRLSHCALACKAWATAAAAATVYVEYSPTAATLPAFESWLQQHAGQILTLKVDCADRYNYEHELLLPVNTMGQLQQLHLKGVIVNSSEDNPSASADGTSNRSMDVDPVADYTTQQAAAAAAAVPTLQQLQLEGLAVKGSSGSSSRGDSPIAEATHPKPAAAAADVLLPRLQQLYLEDIELGSISTLVQLTQSQGLVSVRLQYITFTGPERPSSGAGLNYKDATVMQRIVEGVSHMLQQLPRRVKVLEMPGFPVPAGALQHIAAMEVSGSEVLGLGSVLHPKPPNGCCSGVRLEG